MINLRTMCSRRARSWPATCSGRGISPVSACRSAPRSAALPVRRPRAVSTPRSLPIALVAEGQRMASICNACRYCEGYCAVFPSIERRLSFAESDLAYLANLCHNCGSCYYACQYAPPHEFNLNLPRLLADVRIETYKKYAWPDPLARLFERGGVIASGVLVACMAVLLLALM